MELESSKEECKASYSKDEAICVAKAKSRDDVADCR